MNDLISRQAALDVLADYIHMVDMVYSTGKLSANDCKDAAHSVLECLPTAERKGKWMKKWRNALNGYTHISGYKCTECNALYPWQTNYCPNCGARMTEETNEN